MKDSTKKTTSKKKEATKEAPKKEAKKITPKKEEPKKEETPKAEPKAKATTAKLKQRENFLKLMEPPQQVKMPLQKPSSKLNLKRTWPPSRKSKLPLNE